MKEVTTLLEQALEACQQATELAHLEQVRIEYLGKKGKFTHLLRRLGELPISERPEFGQLINHTKETLSEALEQSSVLLRDRAFQKQMAEQTLDVTLPGRGMEISGFHPVTLARQRIEQFFLNLGFEIVEGPEVESNHYNFEALNIPSSHPARAQHDTFYFTQDLLLRTHTSPVQVRTMEARKPPLRLIAPGRVYRCDSDVTHTPMFHQVEGLYLDKQVSMADLKSVLYSFFQFYFEKDLKIRFRPHYFPFTEPSAEVDISCVHCDGQGCRICKHSGWLEVMGCGMVHPKVLQSVNIDPTQFSGWAFGCGIDRLAMLKYRIEDLRTLFDSDLRFLSQFGWG